MKRILLLFCFMSLATHLASAEERSSLTGQLGSTTLSGYINASISWLGQSDPGPATGGGIDRFYDDGFVRVDATGNPGGYTSFWGYEDASQIQNGFISFHCQTILDANTVQFLADTYELPFLFAPDAPYMGGFDGPGPVLPDTPFSRTITVVPEPSCFALAVMTAMVATKLRTQKPDAFKHASTWRSGE
jgi:hypothetical protein